MVATFLMNDISRMCRQLVDKQMRAIGLTRAQWYLLNYVHLYDGVSQQELADLIDLGKSNLGQQVRILEKKGWVIRKPHEKDGRSFRVYMTKKMKPTIRKLNMLADIILKGSMDRLDGNEVNQLIFMLKAVDVQLEATLARGEPLPKVKKLMEEISQDLA